jgi:hypothetical protein
LLCNVGTYLQSPSDAEYNHINEITFAAILNDREMLERCMEKYSDSHFHISQKMARSGNFRAPKWVIKMGCIWIQIVKIEMLKWLHGAGCPWDEYTCYFAAEEGNLEMLKWLHSPGCPWNQVSLGRVHMLLCSFGRKSRDAAVVA